MSERVQLTAEQLHILQHSLGCDRYGKTEYRGRDEGDGCFEFHRNRYVSTPTEDLAALEAAGLMTSVPAPRFCDNTMRCYFVTAEGRAAMLDQSPESPNLTRSQRRYRAFLRWSDGNGGTFREFLRTTGGRAHG